MIQEIQSSVCKVEAPKNGFPKDGRSKDQITTCILVLVTFGGLSFWLTPLPVLLIRNIQQRRAGLEFDSILGAKALQGPSQALP